MEWNKGTFVQCQPQLPHAFPTVRHFTQLSKSSSSNAPHLCTGWSQWNRSLCWLWPGLVNESFCPKRGRKEDMRPTKSFFALTCLQGSSSSHLSIWSFLVLLPWVKFWLGDTKVTGHGPRTWKGSQERERRCRKKGAHGKGTEAWNTPACIFRECCLVPSGWNKVRNWQKT